MAAPYAEVHLRIGKRMIRLGRCYVSEEDGAGNELVIAVYSPEHEKLSAHRIPLGGDAEAADAPKPARVPSAAEGATQHRARR